MGGVGRAIVRRAFLIILVVVALLSLGTCQDYDLYSAIRGLGAYVGALDTIGHVSAVARVGALQHSPGPYYLYVLSAGDKPQDADVPDNDAEMADDKIYVVDITDPDAPTVMNSIPAPPGGTWYDSWHRDLEVWWSNYVTYLVVVGDDLTLYDLSDPLNPVLTGSCDALDGRRIGGYTPDGRIFLEEHNGGGIYDVTDPANPELYSRYQYIEQRGASTMGGLIALGSPDGVLIYDLADGVDPTTNLLSTFSTSTAVRDVGFVTDSRLAAIVEPNDLVLIDVSVPGAPTEISKTGLASGLASSILVGGRGAELWVGDYRNLWHIDLSDYAHPEVPFAYSLPGPADLARTFMNKGIVGYENCYIPGGDYGLMVYERRY